MVFLSKRVNARSNINKVRRTTKLCRSHFIRDLLKNVKRYKEDTEFLWNCLASTLGTDKSRKTIVFSMKAFDLVNLILEGKYLEFPTDIPIPVDVHVRDVSIASGLISEYHNDQEIIDAWIKVLRKINTGINPKVNLLRIDSILWQAGKKISGVNFDKEYSKSTLFNYFTQEVNLEEKAAMKLAEELTYNVDNVKSQRKRYS